MDMCQNAKPQILTPVDCCFFLGGLYTNWILLVSWIMMTNHGGIHLPTTMGWYARGAIVSTAVSESSHFGRLSGQCPKTLWPGKVIQ